MNDNLVPRGPLNLITKDKMSVTIRLAAITNRLIDAVRTERTCWAVNDEHDSTRFDTANLQDVVVKRRYVGVSVRRGRRRLKVMIRTEFTVELTM